MTVRPLVRKGGLVFSAVRYFGLTSFSPIFAVQALTTLAALTFSASTCTFFACTLETHGAEDSAKKLPGSLLLNDCSPV